MRAMRPRERFLESTFEQLCEEVDAKRRAATKAVWQAPGWKEAEWDAAAASTVEALMMGLRERGIAALTEPKVRRRLAECDEQQVEEVGNRLQKLKPEVLWLGKGKLHRGWTAEEVEILLQTWGALR